MNSFVVEYVMQVLSSSLSFPTFMSNLLNITDGEESWNNDDEIKQQKGDGSNSEDDDDNCDLRLQEDCEDTNDTLNRQFLETVLDK